MSNTIDWGKIHSLSWSPETNLTGTATSSFSNTYSTEYDGVDAYIETDSTYSELDSENKATFSMWIKPTNLTNYRIIMHTPRNTTSSNSQFLLFLRIDGSLDFSMDITSYYARSVTSAITAGVWNHVLIGIDFSTSGNINMYVNGSDVLSVQNLNTRSAFATSTGSLLIGEETQGYILPFLGNIDEFAIWSGTDLSSDVSTIYNSGVPNNLNDNGLTAPTSWYRFEEGTGTTIADSGSSTNAATIQNTVTFETDVPT